MCQWIGTALLQIMACHLFGAKPLSKPMLGYCQLDRQEQTSVKFKTEFYHFHYRNACENVICQKSAILSRGRWVNVWFTETKMSPFWWNFHHWLHWQLSFWQLSVQPVMKISSKWRHFRFSVVPPGGVLSGMLEAERGGQGWVAAR